jgi:glycine cleavage system aminomethyltransferase T
LTVARLAALAHVNRRLVALRWQGPQIPQSGMELTADTETLGHVTSAVWSPKLGGPFGLGYLRRGDDRAGASVHTAAGAAEVVDLPQSG